MIKTGSRSRSRSRSTGNVGAAIDAYGAQAYDPSENVLQLSEAAVARIDDMAELREKLVDEKTAGARREMASMDKIAILREHHNEEIRRMEAMLGRLREEYQEKVARAESGRLDSIRQVDREEVAKTAVAANTAITTLAKQTTDLQQTLAKQVTDTAAAQEARNSAQYSDTNKRLSALELASSEGKGKQTVADPQMERLGALVERLDRNQVNILGRSTGSGDAVKWIALAISMIVGLILIGTFVFVTSRQPAPVVYAPAPAGSLVPTTPAVPPR